jgi:hypothetical protein
MGNLFSFSPQTLGGIGIGGFDGLEPNRHKCDQKSCHSSDCLQPPLNKDPVGEILQPFLHKKQGKGNERNIAKNP